MEQMLRYLPEQGSQTDLWLQVFVPAKQEHIWLDSFNQLTCYNTVDLLLSGVLLLGQNKNLQPRLRKSTGISQ